MSLFDYLNGYDALGAASSSSSASQMAQLLQQIQAKQNAAAPGDTGNTVNGASNAASVLITVDAQRANAEATDAKKDAGQLAKELRATLDKGGADASMSALSGRGLAMIALNQGGTFSAQEVYAAKTELRERDRQSAITFLNSGDLTAASLKSYSQQLLAARQSMSAEEQQLRDIDPNLR